MPTFEPFIHPGERKIVFAKDIASVFVIHDLIGKLVLLRVRTLEHQKSQPPNYVCSSLLAASVVPALAPLQTLAVGIRVPAA